MRVINTEKLFIKSWCNEPEQGAIKQAINLAQLPFAHHHIALMPDTHQGYGMPIGGVLATRDVIVPNAVGVDIGCGVLACQTSLTEITTDKIKKIMGYIRENIPVGFNHRDKPHEIEAPPENALIAKMEHKSAQCQIGTLGGGNHFIEIQRGDDGHIWFMIHSGSRNIGKKVCDHYNEIAKALNTRWFSSVPDKWDLAFFPVDTEEGQRYIAEMEYCTRFAAENRNMMASIIGSAFFDFFHGMICCQYNVHHNYARLENHFGGNAWVHRKGATSAREGEIGIIPGSQGTKSYIVTGLGNRDSFESCSHGAGRRMGRKEAQRTLSLDDEIKKMEEKGIIHGIRNIDDLDEAAGAYKDIDVVMAEQSDLVKINVELTPLGVIKG
jgi:tRNA-splicing ligase RtcB